MKKSQKAVINDPKLAAAALEQLFAIGHMDRKTLYFENFMRGLFFSLGGVIGATILLALIVWILSLFEYTFLRPVIQPITQSLQQTK